MPSIASSELYYQPKWDFRRNAFYRRRALIRWNHPELGRLSPAKFIPIAEDSGLVLPMGEWVLGAALREISRLQGESWPDLRIAVNLSGRRFHHGVCPAWCARCCRRCVQPGVPGAGTDRDHAHEQH